MQTTNKTNTTSTKHSIQHIEIEQYPQKFTNATNTHVLYRAQAIHYDLDFALRYLYLED